MIAPKGPPNDQPKHVNTIFKKNPIVLSFFLRAAKVHKFHRNEIKTFDESFKMKKISYFCPLLIHASKTTKHLIIKHK